MFRHHTHAAAWVRAVLRQRLSRSIDWSTFQPAHGRTTGLRLRAHHADLVFSAKLLGSHQLVLFVIEHKSSPDGDLHWQVLRYSVHLAHTTQRRRGERPLSLPLALTHGGAPITTTAWPAVPPDVAAEFAPHQPKLELLVDDLSASTEGELLARDLPAL